LLKGGVGKDSGSLASGRRGAAYMEVSTAIPESFSALPVLAYGVVLNEEKLLELCKMEQPMQVRVLKTHKPIHGAAPRLLTRGFQNPRPHRPRAIERVVLLLG